METSRISSFYRSLIVLATVLLGQLIVVGYQLRTQADIPLVRLGTVLIIEPLNRSLNAVSGAIHDAWFGYLDLRSAREQSKALSEEMADLKLANQRLLNAEDEARRLRALMDLRSVIPVETVVARVVGGSAGESSRLLMVDKGASAGIRQDAPVMVPDGVVGKVLKVFPNSAQVILLSDPFSGAGVLLEQTRMHGVLKGRNEDLLLLDFISNGEQVATGQRVLTSGEDKIYPPGLPVGTVESARQGQKFLDVRVRPSASLQSLELVMIILRSDFEMSLPEPVRLGPPSPVKTSGAAPAPAHPATGAVTSVSAAPTTARPAAARASVERAAPPPPQPEARPATLSPDPAQTAPAATEPPSDAAPISP